MSEQEYFKHALSNFTFDVAGSGMIRHLAERGYTVKQIMGKLDYPIPYEKVRQSVWEYLLEQQVILLEEPGKNMPKQKTVYVEEQGKFGKKSFRRVTASTEDGGQIQWRKVSCDNNSGTISEETELIHLLEEECRASDRKAAYVSCDYGMLVRKGVKQFTALMDLLEERQREYIEGLPWVNQRVYHCMDQRMWEIIYRLLRLGKFSGNCYFIRKEDSSSRIWEV